VVDDVTWLQKVKVVTRHVWSLISQLCETDGRFKLTTYRKPHIASPMVTWAMTSRDPKRSRPWPNIVETKYLKHRAWQTIGSNWLAMWNRIRSTMVTWAMMSLVANCDRQFKAGGLLGPTTAVKFLANEG